MPKNQLPHGERGSALVVALLVVVVLSALLTAYSIATMGEAKLATSSTNSIHGQLAAEAGVNLRSPRSLSRAEILQRDTASSRYG